MSKRSIRTEIIINAAKETVWNLLTDFEQYPSWNPFLISVKGELQAGSRLQNTLQTSSRQFVFKPTVRKVVPGSYFDWLGSMFFKGLFDGHHYFGIEEINPGQVKLLHGENFSGVLVSFILRKVGDDTRNGFLSMNQALKQQAESR